MASSKLWEPVVGTKEDDKELFDVEVKVLHLVAPLLYAWYLEIAEVDFISEFLMSTGERLTGMVTLAVDSLDYADNDQETMIYSFFGDAGSLRERLAETDATELFMAMCEEANEHIGNYVAVCKFIGLTDFIK